MQMTRQGSALVVKAPAKLNLFLEVLGLRPDGYHELETVMQAVSIFDELTIEGAREGITLACDASDIPLDRTNLVVRAGELLLERVGKKLGAKVRLVKRIPVGAGMGGGSSDGAAALAGLNQLWGLKLPTETLVELASKLGSDVAFFLQGGTAACRGRGEKVTPIEGAAPRTYVVVYPDVEVSTRAVYEKLPATLTNDYRDIKLFMSEVKKGGGAAPVPAFFNRLEDTTLRLFPELGRLKREMSGRGLEGVTMTGSGSAFFGIPRGRKEADLIAKQLRDTGLGSVFVAETTG